MRILILNSGATYNYLPVFKAKLNVYYIHFNNIVMMTHLAFSP